MDFAITHTRSTDPATSAEAARTARRSRLSHRERIYQTLAESRNPLTSWDIALITGLRPDQVWKRVSDLNDDGLVEAVDLHENYHGNIAHAWSIR